MGNEFPNVVVIYGSQSRILKETTQWLLSRDCQIIRIFKTTVPEPNPQCIDIDDFANLNSALEQVRAMTNSEPKIAFLGAAFSRQNSLVIQMSDSDVDHAIDTNIKSYVQLSRLLLPYMIRNKYGRFIFLSSFRAEHSNPGAVIYGASKAFCEQYFSGIGREFGRFNILSCSLRMGYFDSGMMDDYSNEMQQQVRKAASIGRLGNGEDIRAAIDFALTNPYSNAGIIELNGGLIRE